MGVKAAMVRIAVVEDSEQDRRELLDCLHRYEKEQKLKFSIEEFQDGEILLPDIPQIMICFLWILR